MNGFLDWVLAVSYCLFVIGTSAAAGCFFGLGAGMLAMGGLGLGTCGLVLWAKGGAR